MRRALALVLVVAAAATLGWFSLRPHHRARSGEVFGVDVSHHQGHIDWRAVAHDHIAFAYVKATEGVTFQDPSFSDNWHDARAAGINVGAYHFFRLCGGTGDAQAQAFLAQVPGGADLPPALDLEFGGNCPDRPPALEVQRQVDAFLARIGKPVILYVGDTFAQTYPFITSLSYGRQWVRMLGQRPPAYLIWQKDDNATVKGIKGGVDLDVASGATFGR